MHDKCGRCPHERRHHIGGGCILCPPGGDRHGYAPAEPDAAQEAAMDELVHLRQEMETECSASGGSDPEGCPFCAQLRGVRMMPRPEAPEGPACTCQIGTWDKFDSPEDCEAHSPAMAPKAPSRPPFTLTYVLASGERREVTLSGDATVRAAFNGTLVITHGSDVRALTEIRPAEGA